MYNFSASLGYILLCFDFLMLLMCNHNHRHSLLPSSCNCMHNLGCFCVPAPTCLGNHTKLTLECSPPYCCSTFGEEELRQKKLCRNPTRVLGAHYHVHAPSLTYTYLVVISLVPSQSVDGHPWPRPGKQSSQKEALPPKTVEITVIQALARDKHQHSDWGMRG